MKQSVHLLWLATLCALLSASCSPIAALHEGSYRIATTAPDANLLSLLGGTVDSQLNFDGTACFSIVWKTSRTAIVWPPGYAAKGNPLAVYNGHNRQVMVAGEKVSLGGGQVVSSEARKVAGCSGFTQSVTFVPTASPTVATPGSEEFDEGQISDMQSVVERNREVFGGLFGDPVSQIVTIFVAPTADPTSVANAKSAVLAATARPGFQYPKPWRLGFVVAGPSLAALDVVVSEVTVAQPWTTDVGTKLMSWNIDAVRHKVRIGVLEITPTLSADARSAFGNLAVLETAEPAIAQ
jgi:hypothetical protein